MRAICLRTLCADSPPATGLEAIAILLLLLALLSFLPEPAAAIDRALCRDDGVTEIPDFADRRDGNTCLMIDPGNGDPEIPFQYEIFHQSGIALSSRDSGESAPFVELRAQSFGKCRTKDKGEYCSYLIWDTVIDNYLSQEAQNDDIWFSSGQAAEYLYVRNSKFLNGWKCQGKAWVGPNGIRCPAADSAAHSDGIQMRKNPVNDGWVVFQDSAVVNGHTVLMLIQDPAEFGSNGSFMFQGFQFGQTNAPIGQATKWIDDCLARGENQSTCMGSSNRLQTGTDMDELWLIDVWGSVKFSSLRNQIGKLVQVNSGCGSTGCRGAIEFSNGWPHPLEGSDPGPGTCPNGLVLQDPTTDEGDSRATFCYTSVENALEDRLTATARQGDCPAPYCPHKAPPFVHLSASGWENPPDTVPNPPPAPALPPPPVLLP